MTKFEMREVSGIPVALEIVELKRKSNNNSLQLNRKETITLKPLNYE